MGMLHSIWTFTQKGPVYKCFVWVFKFFVSICGYIVRFFCKSWLSKASIPEGLFVKVNRANSAIVKWLSAPESLINPSTYEFEICQSDGDTKTHPGPFRTKGKHMLCKLGSLKPSSTYTIRVRAMNVRGPGAYSNPVEFRTLAVPSARNGGTGPLGRVSGIPGQYTWTQTDNELELTFELPSEVDAKRLTVKFAPRHLHATVAGSTDILIDADTPLAVKTGNCTWYKDPDRNQFTISLWKVDA